MLENEKACRRATDPGCGSNTLDSFGSFTPDPTDPSAPWQLKMSQASLFEDLILSSESWPRCGTMRNGTLYERPTFERRIAAPESSLWLTPNQTPEATSNNGTNAGRPATGKSLAKQADGRWPTPQATDANSAARHTTTTGVMHPGTTLTDAMRAEAESWSTPRSACNVTGKKTMLPPAQGGKSSKPSLEDQARKDWPTPIAEDAESRTSNGTLLDSARDWLTPCASDANGMRELDGVRSGGLNTQAGLDWSTPTARDKETLAKVTRGQMATPGGTPLLVQVQDWQTPMPSDVLGGRTTKGKDRPTETGLRQQASGDWMTPQSRDYKGISQASAKGEEGSICDQLQKIPPSGPLDPANPSTRGSRPVVLNPAWVAALMGFPADWLDGVAPPSRLSGTPLSRKSPSSSRVASGPSSKKGNE